MNRQYLEFQDFIRTQNTNVKKYNILDVVGQLLRVLYETLARGIDQWDPVTLDLCDRVMGFICVATEGAPCKGNQQFLSASIVSTLQLLLLHCQQLGESLVIPDSYTDAIIQVKLSVYCVLDALLDSTDDLGTINNVLNNLQPNVLKADIVSEWHSSAAAVALIRHKLRARLSAMIPGTLMGAFLTLVHNWRRSWTQARRNTHEAEFMALVHKRVDCTLVAVRSVRLHAYCLLCYLAEQDLGSAFQHELTMLQVEHESAYQYCSEGVKCLEVMRDGVVHRIFFAIPRVCIDVKDVAFFQKHAISEFSNVVLDNPDLKVEELSSKWVALRNELLYYKLLMENPKLKIVVQRIDDINMLQV